jgi:hypothetical protein
VPSILMTGSAEVAGPAELEMVAVGEDGADVTGDEAMLGVGVGVADGLGEGLDWLPSIVPTIQPAIAAGIRSATRTDRWPILVPGAPWVTNLL